MKLTIGKKYLWSKAEDVVLVKDIEKDIAFVEVMGCKDKVYTIGQRIWVFINDMKEQGG